MPAELQEFNQNNKVPIGKKMLENKK